MKQRIVLDRITDRSAALGRRPEFWLISLLLWTLLSACRSLGTPWAQAALTEALRWSAGIGLALTLGWFLRRTALAGQFLVTLTGAMALFGILDTGTPASSGMVGPYHDHQLYGSVLLLLLPFCAGTALTARQAPWRWGAFAAFTAGTLCLLLSQTRSAWAGLAAASFVFGWLWLRRSANRPYRLRVVLIPALILLLGLCFVWLLNGPPDQRAAMTSRAATLTALSQDGSWQSRLELWRGTGQMIAAHPALGIGLGRYPGEQWRWTHSGGPLAPFSPPSLSNEAHSFYGQTAAETGLIGLFLFLAGLAAYAAQSLQRLQETRHHSRGERVSRGSDTIVIAALSALAGQSVDAFASPSWQFPEVSFLFWAILGLGLAALRREQASPVVHQVSDPLRRAGRLALSGGIAVVLAAQFLPLGLLSPVEAYTAAAGWTVSAVTVTSVPSPLSVPVGSTVQFKVIATYKKGSATYSVDVTLDSGTTTNGKTVGGTTYVGSIASQASFQNTDFVKGALKVPVPKNSTPASTLNVFAYYQDDAGGTTVGVTAPASVAIQAYHP